MARKTENLFSLCSCHDNQFAYHFQIKQNSLVATYSEALLAEHLWLYKITLELNYWEVQDVSRALLHKATEIKITSNLYNNPRPVQMQRKVISKLKSKYDGEEKVGIALINKEL